MNPSALVPITTAANETGFSVAELREFMAGPDLEVHGAGDYVYRHSVEKLKVRRGQVGSAAP